MTDIRLGLRENWQQFTLLVVVNAFVGGMIGLELATATGSIASGLTVTLTVAVAA
jgi:hypothetical protein